MHIIRQGIDNINRRQKISLIDIGLLICEVLQEEIRFLISPELILARLFCSRMEDTEAIIVTGFERFSNYKGYSANFKYAGPHYDTREILRESRHRK